MDLATFEAEAERLARVGVILRDAEGDLPTAYWHGLKSAGLCLSLARDGQWLNVYLDDDDGGYAEHSTEPARSRTPLFGEAYTSLPPVDGVFLKGSDVIGEFLRYHDWPRTEPFNGNFPDIVPGKYEEVWQNNCPLYQSDVVAALGGWHFPWPDGDWRDLVDHELVAWTIRDAEPWVEVFQTGRRYIVKQRIT